MGLTSSPLVRNTSLPTTSLSSSSSNSGISFYKPHQSSSSFSPSSMSQDKSQSMSLSPNDVAIDTSNLNVNETDDLLSSTKLKESVGNLSMNDKIGKLNGNFYFDYMYLIVKFY